jgi:hypothetical protein
MGLIANRRLTCYGGRKIGNVGGMSSNGTNGKASQDGTPDRTQATVENMVGFGTKQAWLAVRDGDPATLTAILGLHDLGEASWRNGVDLAYLTDDRLAVTPPLPGADGASWVLVTGRWLLSPRSTVDIQELSAALDSEVQFFASYRVGEAHRWERAIDGILVRSFSYVGEIGEVTDWRGDPDDAELAIGLPAAVDENSEVLISETDVMRLAAAWSVDPNSLDGRPAPGPLRVATAPA